MNQQFNLHLELLVIACGDLISEKAAISIFLNERKWQKV